jgi:hypothetical protein
LQITNLNQHLKNEKKPPFATLLIMLITIAVRAQDTYQPGYVLLANGTRIGGYIQYNDKAPWYNQRYIFIKDSAAVAANPNASAKKYTVDELKSYVVGNRLYTKVHYVDYDNLQMKSLGANDHMLETFATGRINAYRFYTYPKDFYIGTSDAELRDRMKKDNDELLRNWKMLIRKDNNSNYKNAFDEDMQKYFADNAEVLAKFQNGEYGNEPVSTKTGLAARMIAKAKQTAYGHARWETWVAAITDYNQKTAN